MSAPAEPIFVDLSESAPTEIESLCMKCHQNGTTRILLSKIPHFKEIIIMAFECPHCGFRNNELQSAGVFNERGHTIKLSIQNKEDMNRQLVKSDYCSVQFLELDLEIPANNNRGLLTTVEGLVDNAIDDLTAGQPLRKAEDEFVYNRIEEIIETMRSYKEGHPFTLVLDDPSGNSYVENKCLPAQDPQIKLRWYNRTPEQQAFLGLQENQTPAEAAAAAAAHDLSDRTIYSATASEMLNAKGLPEVMSFPANCPSCNAPCATNMHLMEIPHFKEVVIMATNCESCGYKSNEVKAGGAISDKGKRITLKMTEAEDLSRDILKSETCGLSIPEINLELTHGTLGGRFTTVEGLLRQVHTELRDRAPFIEGDSGTESGKDRWARFLDNLTKVADGKLLPVTLIIDDPLANSYLQNLYAPDPDPEMTIEEYERSWEMNEDLGVNDMKLENYEQHETPAKHEAPHDEEKSN
ncbi:ZPR1 zinc-finger domain-containing protein [Mucor mucedo]|uniref:ZPR1 zinc-finger domain-containing protein n=1 Tax=Mucor mucedo TaxID=29922 RepID=UPI00221EB6A4|nr:ZPR1 zinc-finger domain-containing protein [Mucor mucedo]KAI7871365.1 ZPR1 zinc-finger domain-containing protein [Mucor mucedo]